MAMDIGNSAARILVRVGADGGHPTYVRTYPCKPGAKAYPGWHAFGFPWWLPDREEAFVGPGCTSEFAKRSNKFPDAMPGLHFHGNPLWYEFGLPESAFALSGDALPVRECNPFVALDVQDITGTTLNADFPDCSVLQFDRAGLIEVVVGHTLAQQVVRWLGCTVGELGGSAFDGVYTVLFEGATVTPVDARTVSVTVAAGSQLLHIVEPLSPTSALDGSESGWMVVMNPGHGLDDLALPPAASLVPGYWIWVTRIAPAGSQARIFAAPGGEVATVDGVDVHSGTAPLNLDAEGDTYLLVCLSTDGVSTSEWGTLVKPGGGGGGGSLTVGTTPIVGGSTGDYLKIGGGGLLASGGLDVPVVLAATGDTVVPLATKAHSGTQSGHLQEWQASGGTPLAWVAANGDVFSNSGGSFGYLYMGPNTDFGLRGGGGIGNVIVMVSGGDAAAFRFAGSRAIMTIGFISDAYRLHISAPIDDTTAEANTLYYSTTQGKLVYKDPGGTVNALY